jgi:hypothetical protein
MCDSYHDHRCYDPQVGTSTALLGALVADHHDITKVDAHPVALCVGALAIIAFFVFVVLSAP